MPFVIWQKNIKMEVAIVPRWLIKHLSKDYFRQNDYNILISNFLLILSFIAFKDLLLSFLESIPHFCLIDKIFNIECPVCGTTRAFCELSSGNLRGAYLLNITSIPVALFFIFQIPLRIISIIKKSNPKKTNMISFFFSRIILTIIALNWIIKLFINN